VLRTLRIVLSGLFMVGRNRDYAPDAPAIDPIRLMAIAIVVTVLVIAGLVFLAISIAG